MTCWLQQARQELSQSWTAAEGLDFAERYQVRQNHACDATGCFLFPSSAVGVTCLLLRCSSASPTPSPSKGGRWRRSWLQPNVALSWASSRALWWRRMTVWRRRWEIHPIQTAVTSTILTLHWSAQSVPWSRLHVTRTVFLASMLGGVCVFVCHSSAAEMQRSPGLKSSSPSGLGPCLAATCRGGADGWEGGGRKSRRRC